MTLPVCLPSTGISRELGLTQVGRKASEKNVDAVHSHGHSSKSWIHKFWPDEKTLDKVRGSPSDTSYELMTECSCSIRITWVCRLHLFWRFVGMR